MKIYLIPGLGYDCRIFNRLNFENYIVKQISWIEPNRQESLLHYAKRLFKDLPVTDEETILIGHSLGGIIAQEIATEKRIDKIILISSIKSRKENPFFFKLISPLKIYKFLTKEFSNKTIKYWGKSHDFKTVQDQELFKSMIGKHSNHYLQWALRSLSTWHSPILPSHTTVFQIHGTKDKNFPIRIIDSPDVVIENGSHFMVYTQPKIINEALLKLLKK